MEDRGTASGQLRFHLDGLRLFDGGSRLRLRRKWPFPLTDAGGLSGSFSQVVEFRPIYLSFTENIDLGNIGGVDRKNPFDADAVRNLADGEGFTVACSLFSDDDALIDLDALFFALDNFNMDSHGGPNFNVRHRLL